MRFIPTKFHAPLDYIVGAALIAAPWILRFSEHTAATVVPVVLGIGLIAYSLFTNYELGIWKVVPMAVHNLIDIAAGTLLAASPWIFGFADETANVWLPHLIVKASNGQKIEEWKLKYKLNPGLKAKQFEKPHKKN